MSDSSTSPLVLPVTAGGEPGIHTVALHGDLDHDTGDLLVDTVRQVLERRRSDSRRPVEIRLDCAGPDLCDSSGLSALLMVLRRCGAAGVRLRLANPGEGLGRVLSITGVASLFDALPPSDAQPGDADRSPRPPLRRDESFSGSRKRR